MDFQVELAASFVLKDKESAQDARNRLLALIKSKGFEEKNFVLSIKRINEDQGQVKVGPIRLTRKKKEEIEKVAERLAKPQAKIKAKKRRKRVVPKTNS